MLPTIVLPLPLRLRIRLMFQYWINSILTTVCIQLHSNRLARLIMITVGSRWRWALTPHFTVLLMPSTTLSRVYSNEGYCIVLLCLASSMVLLYNCTWLRNQKSPWYVQYTRTVLLRVISVPLLLRSWAVTAVILLWGLVCPAAPIGWVHKMLYYAILCYLYMWFNLKSVLQQNTSVIKDEPYWPLNQVFIPESPPDVDDWAARMCESVQRRRQTLNYRCVLYGMRWNAAACCCCLVWYPIVFIYEWSCCCTLLCLCFCADADLRDISAH